MRSAMILVSVVATAGCRSLLDIEDPVVLADASQPDAFVGLDVPSSACHVGTTGAPVERGRVGSNGGLGSISLVCGAGEMVVGIAIRMSDQSVNGGTRRSAQGLSIACASVILDGTSPTIGPVTTHEAKGTGAAGWSPSTLSAPTLCDPGWVVSGLTAKIGPISDVFLDVVMACSELSPAAHPVAITTRHVDGSLTDTVGITTAMCGANEVLVEARGQTAAGFDAARIFCAPSSCL